MTIQVAQVVHTHGRCKSLVCWADITLAIGDQSWSPSPFLLVQQLKPPYFVGYSSRTNTRIPVLLVNLPQSTFRMHIQVTNVSPRAFKGQASVLSDLPGPVILRGAFKVGLWTVQYFNLLLDMGIYQPPKEHCVAAFSTLAMFVSNII